MEQSNIAEWNRLFLDASNPFNKNKFPKARDDSKTKFEDKSINS